MSDSSVGSLEADDDSGADVVVDEGEAVGTSEVPTRVGVLDMEVTSGDEGEGGVDQGRWTVSFTASKAAATQRSTRAQGSISKFVMNIDIFTFEI